ncbi:MAG: hypothetical protein EHM40_22495, partial [Chloroflexi bacterium]
MLDGMPGLTNRKSHRSHKGWLAGLLVLIPLLIAALVWFRAGSSQPREAPEAERVLTAQAEL